MKKIYGRIFLAMALACLPCASNAQTLVSERSISANAALEMATVALEACRKHGSVVTITVLDRADRVVVSIRDDGASPHSVEHSLRKAHTALTYDMSSAEFGKNAAKESRQRRTAAFSEYHYCSGRSAHTRGQFVGRCDRRIGHARLEGRRNRGRCVRASRHRPYRERPHRQLTRSFRVRERGLRLVSRRRSHTRSGGPARRRVRQIFLCELILIGFCRALQQSQQTE